MIPVVIYRDEWYRGRGVAGSQLLREDGRKCCVGFICLAAGAKEKDILGRGVISNSMDAGSWGSFRTQIPSLQRFIGGDGIRYHVSEQAGRLYGANDDINLTEYEREAHVVVLSAELGFQITFEDSRKVVQGVL